MAEVCPTCKSPSIGAKYCVNPEHYKGVHENLSLVACIWCPDPWHKVDSLPRCPTCRSENRGKRLCLKHYITCRGNIFDCKMCDNEAWHGEKVDSLPVEATPTKFQRIRAFLEALESAEGFVCHCAQCEELREMAGVEAKPASKHFTIEVLQEKDGRWLADIPSVPGAMAYGKTEWEVVWRSIAIKWESEKL